MEHTSLTCSPVDFPDEYPCNACLRAAFHRGYRGIGSRPFEYSGDVHSFHERMLRVTWRTGATLAPVFDEREDEAWAMFAAGMRSRLDR